MKKYLIYVGKFNEYGTGDEEIVYSTNDLKEAQKKFDEQVEYEKRTISGWHLYENQFVEISLAEIEGSSYEDYNDEDYLSLITTLDIVRINKRGKEI